MRHKLRAVATIQDSTTETWSLKQTEKIIQDAWIESSKDADYILSRVKVLGPEFLLKM
jgi:hypothetical protein